MTYDDGPRSTRTDTTARTENLETGPLRVCSTCGHKWRSKKKAGYPKRCPAKKCGTSWWDIPRGAR